MALYLHFQQVSAAHHSTAPLTLISSSANKNLKVFTNKKMKNVESENELYFNTYRGNIML